MTVSDHTVITNRVSCEPEEKRVVQERKTVVDFAPVENVPDPTQLLLKLGLAYDRMAWDKKNKQVKSGYMPTSHPSVNPCAVPKFTSLFRKPPRWGENKPL
jgi:hypothetical protein